MLIIDLFHIMSPTYRFNEVHDFQKCIKHDIMLYPIFKDDWQYDSLYHETHAIASTIILNCILE